MSTTRIAHGVYGGLVGGGVFGVMMAMMGMLPMIGGMVGMPSALTGFVVRWFEGQAGTRGARHAQTRAA